MAEKDDSYLKMFGPLSELSGRQTFKFCQR